MNKENKKVLIELGLRFACFYLIAFAVGLVKEHNVKVNSPQVILEELSDEGVAFDVYDKTYGSGEVVSITASSHSEKRTLDAKALKKLNRLINSELIDVDALNIYGLSSEIDFSSLDLQDIDKVSFVNVGDDFDYRDLKNWCFSDVDFSQVPMNDQLEGFLEESILDYTDISVSDDELPLLKYLASIDKEVRGVTVSSIAYDDEISKILEKIKSKKITINLSSTGDSKPFDLDLHLNDTVEEVILRFDSIVDFQTVRLGNISIYGRNDNLSVIISACKDSCKVVMDDKTVFDLPDQTFVTFENVACENTAVFNSLANVDGLDYSDGKGIKATFTDETSHNQKVKYR